MTLIGYWPLTEDSGDTVYDHSGNGNHGTINNDGDSTVPGGTGILGQNACQFDGSNDYIGISHDSSLDGMESLTISVWIYPTDTSRMDVVNKYNTSTDERSYNIQMYRNGDEVQFYVSTDGSNNEGLTGGTAPPTNEWSHLVLTWDGETGEAEYFLNGIKDTKSTLLTGSINNSVESLYIGSQRDNAYYIEGKMGEVRIYNHALTASEVQYLYNVSQRGRHFSSKKTL